MVAYRGAGGSQAIEELAGHSDHEIGTRVGYSAGTEAWLEEGNVTNVGLSWYYRDWRGARKSDEERENGKDCVFEHFGRCLKEGNRRENESMWCIRQTIRIRGA